MKATSKRKNKKLIERADAAVALGLTSEQVAKRVGAGLVNTVKNKNSKSYFKIIVDNVCTFYNLLALACFIALVCVHTPQTPLSTYAFILIYLVNIFIGIIQEIKAKRTLDKLSLVKTPTAVVVRDGEEKTVAIGEIVLDDIVKLSLGMQVPADAVMISGHVMTDESMLTGESVAVPKEVGDQLYGGSFVTNGNAVVRIDKVGEDCYLNTLTQKAKKFKKTNSELLNTLNHIINVVGAIIAPIAVVSGFINYSHLGDAFVDSLRIAETVKRTTAVVIGLIPGGMFLLTTLALAVGIINLAKQNTLVQDMYSLETLARVNVLCLDKTGTITDGKLTVSEVVEIEKCAYESIIANFERATGDVNFTAEALKARFVSRENYEVDSVVPFNSARKYAAVNFGGGKGSFVLGAPEFVLEKPARDLQNKIDQLTAQGKRVLALAKAAEIVVEDEKPKSVSPLILIALEDNLRPEAIDTIKWFRQNDVAVKVISGDNPTTVSRISMRAGVEGADKCISLYGLTDEQVIDAAKKFTVFGRVSPEQKALIVKTLKADGATVAMTGDGVNDIPAMKEADCSVTVADGNSSTRSIAHLVLLTDDFNCLPKVVAEGRRVINNVSRSAALYLMKTAFTMFLAIASAILFLPYPLDTGKMLALETMIIGLPSVVLSVQPNAERNKGRFIAKVLTNSLPGTLVLLINVLLSLNADAFGFAEPKVVDTVLVYAITFGGYAFLITLCMPIDKFRGVLLIAIFALITVWATVLASGPLFKLLPLSFDKDLKALIFIAVTVIADVPIAYYSKRLFGYMFSPQAAKAQA